MFIYLSIDYTMFLRNPQYCSTLIDSAHHSVALIACHTQSEFLVDMSSVMRLNLVHA